MAHVRTILVYGLALAVGALVLQWLDYQIWARTHAANAYVALIAAAFLVLGLWIGTRIIRSPRAVMAFAPNDRAQAALGITAREYEVLQLLALGRSNKEIARQLHRSPNTIKTHIARLYEKLEVARRTTAILRARELGLIP